MKEEAMYKNPIDQAISDIPILGYLKGDNSIECRTAEGRGTMAGFLVGSYSFLFDPQRWITLSNQLEALLPSYVGLNKLALPIVIGTYFFGVPYVGMLTGRIIHNLRNRNSESLDEE
jgi:hypothetical protein